MVATVTDDIPRVRQLVPHMRDQLLALRGGATFEDARRRYGATVDRLAAEGRGRRTVSRISDRDAGWAAVRDLLEETMRLGLVGRDKLPSAKKYLDEYRDRAYLLTAEGIALSEAAEHDFPEFVSRLTEAVIAAHPYFRGLIEALADAPIVYPEIGIEDLRTAQADGWRSERWAAWATKMINRDGYTSVSEEAVAEEMLSVTSSRFGRRPEARPGDKQLVEALNDAFSAAAVRARGLPMGATNLKSLKAWGSQFAVLDESRYVAHFERANVIWLAASLHRSANAVDPSAARPVLERRGIDRHGDAVAARIVSAYRELSETMRQEAISALEAPYIPIYAVRAEAAYAERVTRALCDLVIERLAEGRYAELGVDVRLHLGRDVPPPSEPVYRRGGSRRFEMTITHHGRLDA